MNKKIFFKADASTSATNLKENGAILAIPYSTINTSSGTPITPGDNIVLSGEMTATIYFKDI